MSKNQKNHGMKLIWLILGVLVLFIIASGMLYAGIYRFGWNNKLTNSLENALPLPALYIDDSGFIYLSDVHSNYSAVKKFYESQDFDKVGLRVDFNTDQGKKRLKIKEKDVINKMIENKIIMSLAKERGISISQAQIDAELQKSITEFGDKEDLIAELARLYGWSINDFRREIVGPQLYSDKLAEIYRSEIDTESQQKKAKTISEQIKSDKNTDFAQLAQKNSEGESAKNGGDLGWSTKDQLISEVASKAYSMKVGEISEEIKSPLGYHIIKLEERKNEDGKDLVHLRQIFIKTDTYADWLGKQLRGTDVSVFLHDYRWNKEVGKVEFTDTSLNEFEKNVFTNSEGDPSVLR